MKQDKDDEKFIHTKTNVERIEMNRNWVHQCINDALRYKTKQKKPHTKNSNGKEIF